MHPGLLAAGRPRWRRPDRRRRRRQPAGLHGDDRLGAAEAPGQAAEVARVAEALDVHARRRRWCRRPPSTGAGRCRTRRRGCRGRGTTRCRAPPRGPAPTRRRRACRTRRAATAARGGWTTSAKVAWRRTSSSVLMSPRQFGPTTRMPQERADAQHLGLERRALRPRLGEPRRQDHRRRTPACARTPPRRRPPTSAGTAMMARSTSSSMSRMLRHGPDAGDVVGVRVHRPHRSREAGALEVLQHARGRATPGRGRRR